MMFEPLASHHECSGSTTNTSPASMAWRASPDAGVDGGVDDVLGAEHVGAHRFERVVLAGRHLLHGGRVHDDLGAFDRARHARPIADVTDEVAQLPVTEAVAHLRLLQLVAG